MSSTEIASPEWDVADGTLVLFADTPWNKIEITMLLTVQTVRFSCVGLIESACLEDTTSIGGMGTVLLL